MDVLNKFIELTKWTYIMGEESQLERFLPSNLKKDDVGNYFIKIGESDTMFCSHLDTAAFKKEKVVHVRHKNKQNHVIMATDGTTLLGADDKAGVVIMLNMIEKKIPGLYYFFMGEESGLVGSKAALSLYEDEFKNYKKCISFDRRGYGSIISCQLGGRCCSIAFVNSLVDEFAKTGMVFKEDTTGVYTDSAVFSDIIPECTNLSVGYFNEHTEAEFQNMTYLEMLVDATEKINWEALNINRDCTPLDTPNPVRQAKKAGDLTDDELFQIFFKVDEIIETLIDSPCANFDNFMPEKDMIYVDPYGDVEEDCTYTVCIHENGSISVEDKQFETYEIFEEKMISDYGYVKSVQTSNDVENADDNDAFDDVMKGASELENDINMNDLMMDINFFTVDNDVDFIEPEDMKDILDKYNKPIESIVYWLYFKGNDPNKTQGLYWDEENSRFGLV